MASVSSLVMVLQEKEEVKVEFLFHQRAHLPLLSD